MHLEEGKSIPTTYGFCMRPVLASDGRHVKERISFPDYPHRIFLFYHVPCRTCGNPAIVRVAKHRAPGWRLPEVSARRRCATCRGVK